MKNVCYLVLLTISNLYSQVNFSKGETLIDLTHYSSNITVLSAADLNNDGYKEIIVGSYYDNTIMFYKNISGNIQYHQRQILLQNLDVNYYSNFDVFCTDINNDGLVDVIVTNKNKVSWFKNLGDYKFDDEIIISNAVSKINSVAAGDIDNDGDNDIVLGSDNDEKISLFKNNGNGTFLTRGIIDNVNPRISEVKLFDLDNNGFLDVIFKYKNGYIYYCNNIDGSSFSSSKYITAQADGGTGIDFLDVNGDSFYDIVFSSYDYDSLKYVLNLNGNSFSSEITIDNSLLDPYGLIVKDFDNDGLKDIVVSTISKDKISWYKNKNGSFSSVIEITSDVTNPKCFLVEDLDNDNSFEIIASSYLMNYSAGQKLSVFKENSISNSYEETIINFYYSAANTVKIADLDNDGNNDIISAFKSIVWNKNYGNNVFSSQYLLSTDIKGGKVRDIEVKDMDSDGWLDVIGLVDNKLEVYKNIKGERFELIHTQKIDNGAEDLEISDINNDNNFDILISHNLGEVPISKVINNGDFNFKKLTPIYTIVNTGFKAYNFKCGDVDNDGDIDIVVGTGREHEIHWLINEGNGTFIYEFIVSQIGCDRIEIGDIDNDGYLDIITASSGEYHPNSFFRIKRNSEGFSAPLEIDVQNFTSITLNDINNDGFLDTVGTSYEYYSPHDERIFYYLYKDKSFESQVTIESLGNTLSLSKGHTLGDLNNDNKLDIVASYYFINSVKYFMNSSLLSLEKTNFEKNKKFQIYPNPSTEFIYWDKELKISKISIYNSVGKLIYDNDKISFLDKLNIRFISKGLYFIVANSEEYKYTTELIIK